MAMKELSEAIDLLESAAEAVDLSLQGDREITLKDLRYFVPVGFKFAMAFKGANEIIAEIKNGDAGEIEAELNRAYHALARAFEAVFSPKAVLSK